MINQRVNNIVVACENKNPGYLIQSIDLALTDKLYDAIQAKKQVIGKDLLEHTGAKSETDNYESYEPKVQEAIDYVVESILEGGLTLENTISMASKQYSVKEESLKEYFGGLLETSKTETQVVSTSSDDGDEKRGMRDDEDTNKRVRYEDVRHEVLLNFKNGGTMIITEELWQETIEPVLNQLSESNKAAFTETLTRDKASFLRALEFCCRLESNL